MSDIDILLSATDKASETINKVNNSLSATGTASKGTGLSLTDLNSAVMLAKQGMEMAKVAFDATVGSTVSYADEVRGLQQVTGASAEETSRLIQVLDDYKVSSQDAMVAQRSLTKDGIVLTTESLAKLSGQYLAITNQADRNAFAQEKLGRNYKAFIEVLQQGPDAINAASAAVNENLIMNQKAEDQARLYQMQIDNLSDAFEGFKIKAGKDALPIVTTALGNFTKEMDKNGAVAAIFKFGFDDIAEAIWGAKGPTEAEAAALNKADKAMKDNSLSADELAESQKEMTDKINAANKAMTDENQTFLSTLGSMQSAEESYQSKIKSLTSERTKIESERAAELAKGVDADIKKIREFDDALKNNSDQADENAKAHDLAEKKIILGLAERKMMQDGVLTDAEIQWLINKGVEWGIYSQKVVDETGKMLNDVNNMTLGIANIPNNKTITFTAVYSNFNTAEVKNLFNSMTPPKKPHDTGGSFLIPDSYGHEGFRLGNGDTASGGEEITIRSKGQRNNNPAPEPIDYNRLARVLTTALAQRGVR